jgi:hypothetical protein
MERFGLAVAAGRICLTVADFGSTWKAPKGFVSIGIVTTGRPAKPR